MVKNQYNKYGVKEGYWEDCDFDGQLRSKGHYMNGSNNGYWEFYWKNGNVWMKGYYVNT